LAEGEGLDPEVAASLSGLKKPLLQLTTALKARLKVSDPKLAEQLDAEIKGTLSPRSPQLTSASAQRVLDLIKKIVEQDSKLSRTVKENIAAAIISLGQTSDNEKLLPLIKEKLLAPIDRQEAPDQIAPKLIRALNHEGLSGDQLVEAVQNNLEKITAGFKGDQDKLAKLDAVLQEVARLTPNSPRTQRLVKEVSAVLAKKRSRPDDNGQTPASAPGSDRPAAPVITAFAPADNDPQRNIANLQARVNELLRQIAAAQAPDPAAEVEPPANVTLEQLTNEVLRLDGELAAKKAALQNLAAKELPALQQQYNELKLKVLNNTVTPQELKKLNDRIQMTEGAIKALEQEVGPLAARLRQLRGQIAALALIEEKKKKERAALDRPDTASPALFGDGQYAGLSAHNELLKIKKKQNNCAPVA
jgi:hypothetical protein